MMREAKEHEQEDKEKKKLVEAKNQADSLVYTIEKTLKDSSDQISSEEKANIEADISDLKNSITTNDVNQINSKIEKLSQTFNPIAQKMYKQSTSQSEATPPPPESESSEQAQDTETSTPEDAEYEIIDEDEKKS